MPPQLKLIRTSLRLNCGVPERLRLLKYWPVKPAAAATTDGEDHPRFEGFEQVEATSPPRSARSVPRAATLDVTAESERAMVLHQVEWRGRSGEQAATLRLYELLTTSSCCRMNRPRDRLSECRLRLQSMNSASSGHDCPPACRARRPTERRSAARLSGQERRVRERRHSRRPVARLGSLRGKGEVVTLYVEGRCSRLAETFGHIWIRHQSSDRLLSTRTLIKPLKEIFCMCTLTHEIDCLQTFTVNGEIATLPGLRIEHPLRLLHVRRSCRLPRS